MSWVSQYQNVFRIAKRDATKIGSQPVLTKRNRASVSCLPCKARKLKCDRQVPCVSCSKREDEASCTYSNPDSLGRNRREYGNRDAEAQLRLQKLEEMVTCLIQMNKVGSERPSDKTFLHSGTSHENIENSSIYSSPQTFESSPRGHLNTIGPEKEYVNSTHWTTILENIREIQDALEHESDDVEDESHLASSDGPDIVLGTIQSLTLTDVGTSLPPRPTVDKLLSVYFNTMHSQTPILHTGKFLREYESFWAEPSSVSFLWISMLFSTLYIGSRNEQGKYQGTTCSSPSPQRATFFKRAGQALMTGNYMKAKPYSVEATLLFGVCKYMQKDEHDTDAWMTMGISTRLAMKMGYHRDPRHLANISPFEGEMRRRTFFILEAFDLLLSFQAGLPAMIHEDECDTEPPSNLFDTDFDEKCEALPPSRPPTDSTPMLYYRYKSRLARIFRRIYRHATSCKALSYEETMNLDAELNRAHKDVPPSLRMKSLALSFTDQPYMILNRLYSDLVYLKSVCVLHRRYLSENRSDPRFSYSRRACGDAALQILTHQAELHGACQPGQLFHEHRWMLSSLSCHDFLLAAMITCLDLYESRKQSTTLSQEDSDSQVKKYDALRHSHSIWMTRREISRDARRASSVLAIMLSKLPRQMKASQKVPNMAQAVTNRNDSLEWPVSSLTSSSFDINGSDLADQRLSTNNDNPADLSTTDSLTCVFGEFDNIDWGVIDQYLADLGDDGDIPSDSHFLDGSEVTAAT